MTTLRDIAEDMGVSVATVSNALSGKGRVSAKLRKRVLAEAERRGYVPSSTGRALRTGRSGVIGLVLPDLANPLFPAIAQSIEEAAQEQGHGVLIADSRGDDAGQVSAVERLVRQGADGLIVIPRRGTRVRPAPVAIAVIDAAENPENTIGADHFDGGRQVMRHLVALGHDRVLITAQTRVSQVQAARVAGMRSEPRARLRQHWLEDGPLPEPATLKAQGVTAIATTSDLIALPLLTQLQVAGFQIPRDFAVTGFDDHRFSGLVAPGLTTVAQDTKSIAQGAIASLIQQLDTGDAPTNATIPVRLIVRGSTDPELQNISNKETPHDDKIDGG